MYTLPTSKTAAAKEPYPVSHKQAASMAEYKLSIYQKIEQFSAHADKGDTVWVTISDECFASMKQNPSYEAWVLDKIRQAYDSCRGDGRDSWVFLKFGASEADFQETVHSMPDRCTRERIRKKEQEEREQLRRKRKKQLEKKLLEEKWRKQKVQETYVQLKILDHRIQVQEENKALRFGADFYPKDHSASLYAAAKRRAAAYETTFIYREP